MLLTAKGCRGFPWTSILSENQTYLNPPVCLSVSLYLSLQSGHEPRVQTGGRGLTSEICDLPVCLAAFAPARLQTPDVRGGELKAHL